MIEWRKNPAFGNLRYYTKELAAFIMAPVSKKRI